MTLRAPSGASNVSVARCGARTIFSPDCAHPHERPACRQAGARGQGPSTGARRARSAAHNGPLEDVARPCNSCRSHGWRKQLPSSIFHNYNVCFRYRMSVGNYSFGIKQIGFYVLYYINKIHLLRTPTLNVGFTLRSEHVSSR